MRRNITDGMVAERVRQRGGRTADLTWGERTIAGGEPKVFSDGIDLPNAIRQVSTSHQSAVSNHSQPEWGLQRNQRAGASPVRHVRSPG